MAQTILRWFGIVYVIVGAVAFFFHDSAGNEFGVLNVTSFHSSVHIVVGIVSIAMSMRPNLTKIWGWVLIFAFALLIAEGIVPKLNPTVMMAPMDGNVMYFHIASLLVAIGVVLASTRQHRHQQSA